MSDARSCLWWLLSVLILDPTVWLDGARPAITCIPVHGEHDAHWLALVGKNWPDSREGGRDTDVGRSSSIKPNSRIQYKNH
jgi:hypothetical protein